MDFSIQVFAFFSGCPRLYPELGDGDEDGFGLRSDWWKFSQGFVTGLELCGCKPRIVGLHGRDNPKITPEDVARIFRTAAEERGGEDDEVLRGRGAQRTWPS